MQEDILMAKKLQNMLDDKAEEIIESLKSKQTKSFFVNMAIQQFANTKDGKNFLLANDEAKDVIKSEKTKKNENPFLPKNSKIRIEEWN
jgi:hypothetical protein